MGEKMTLTQVRALLRGAADGRLPLPKAQDCMRLACAISNHLTQPAQCPYIVNGKGGSSYCRLAESAKPAQAVDVWTGEIECCDDKGFWLVLADGCPFVPGQKVTITAANANGKEG